MPRVTDRRAFAVVLEYGNLGVALERRKHFMHFHLADPVRERHMCFGRELLIVEEQDEMFVQRGFDFRKRRIVNVTEVGPLDIGANRRGARRNLNLAIFHDGYLVTVIMCECVRVPDLSSRSRLTEL